VKCRSTISNTRANGGANKQNASKEFFTSSSALVDASPSLEKSADQTATRISNAKGLPSVNQNRTETSGQPLPASTRGFMESKFNHDFSNVRIHNDPTAHRTAASMHAQAFTYGNHISFNKGKYDTQTKAGNHLLAHELTHVVQQSGGAKSIQRKLEVLRPDDNIPNPSGKGIVQTNGQAVLDYFKEICGDANASITGGAVTIDQTLCSGSGKDKDGKPVSNIQLSKTPAGCGCICEMANSPNSFKIQIDDSRDPATSSDDLKKAQSTGSGATVTVVSPNRKDVKTLSKSGNLEDTPPFLVLAHELCGHASFMNKGKFRDDFFGNAVTGRGEHTATTNIENKIRGEHNIEARGTHRDPCCGADLDGIFRGSGATNCKDFLKTQKAIALLQNPESVLSECLKWRTEFNELNGTNFTLEDSVPLMKDEITPAEYRFDVFFNKDMPLAGAASGLPNNVTTESIQTFEVAEAIINNRGDIKKIQVEGYASSDKPKNDPDYNTRLVDRRVNLIKSELLKKGVNPGLFISFQPTIPGKTCSEMEAGSFNCSDTESSAKTSAKDRKVVIRFTKF